MDEGRIALWPYRSRRSPEESEDHPPPTLTGRVTIGGVDYWISLWRRERSSPKQPLFSGNIKPVTDEIDIHDDTGGNT